jgi:mono/diheme cytochrome c family protein
MVARILHLASTWRPRRQRWHLAAVLIVLLLSACQQHMASQPSFRPDEPNSFFPDGRENRPFVPGTVARGHLRTDLHLFEGKRAPGMPARAVPAAVLGTAASDALGTVAVLAAQESAYADTFPFSVTRAVLGHGQDRYMIYCVVCHDALGTGHGKIVERGYTAPPSYHIDRLREVPVGYIFDVITNGYGSMPDYKQQIPPRDRWAIVAYVRALQLSQHFPVKDLPENLRREMERHQTVALGSELP